MNVSCPTEDQVRDQTDRKPGGQLGTRKGIRSHARAFNAALRSVFTTARSGVVRLFMVLCLNCQAADRASWYGEQHRGLLMANGQPFNPSKLTAASWFFDLGTKVVVTHENRSVVVEITDRGPAKRLFQEGRKIDLSRAAFAKLADPDLGLIDVAVRRQ